MIVGCGSPKLDRPNDVDFSTHQQEQSGEMLDLLLGLFRLIWLFGKGHHPLSLENLSLQQEIAVYSESKSGPAAEQDASEPPVSPPRKPRR